MRLRHISPAFVLIPLLLPTKATDHEPEGLRQSINQIMAIDQKSSQRDEEFLSEFTARFRAAIVKDMSGPEIGVNSYGILCYCQHAISRMRILSIKGQRKAFTDARDAAIKANTDITTGFSVLHRVPSELASFARQLFRRQAIRFAQVLKATQRL